MPVLRKMIYENLGGFTIKMEEIAPEDESAHCAGMVANNNPHAPHWTQDPTYHLTTRRKRR